MIRERGKKLLEGGSRLEREGLRENSRRDEVKKTQKKIEKKFSLAFGFLICLSLGLFFMSSYFDFDLDLIMCLKSFLWDELFGNSCLPSNQLFGT